MPPVVAAIGAVVASLGVPGTIALAVGVAAAGYAYYAAQKAKNMNTGSTKAAERKQTFRSSNAPKQVVFGESEASGPIVFVQEEGAPNDSGKGEILHMVVPLAGHACDDCLGVRVGDLQFSKVSDTAEGSHWQYRTGDTTHGQIWYYSRAKNAQGVPESLEGVAQWDDAMIGCGQTFLHARLRSDPDQWPSGVEDIVAKLRGWWVYDPRTKSNVWSTNPVLQARHYIRHVLLVPEAHIIEDTFIQAANICDETVVRAGKSEPRYCCHAIFDEESDPQEVLGNIAACMAGEFIRSGGLWAARAGAYYGPATRTLKLDEVVGDLDIRISLPLEDRVNTITGQYLEPEQGYNLTDFPALSRPEYIEEDGRERVEDVSYDFVQSSTQAQALGWIELEKRRRGATVTGTFKLSAIDAVMGMVVKLDQPQLAGLEFRVVNWKFDPAGNGLRLELREDHPDIWTGQPARIVQPLLPGNLDSRDPRSVQAVTELTFTRTDGVMNQHGVLGWKASAAEYEVVLLDGDDVLMRERIRATVLPITLPLADKTYEVSVTAFNSFGVSSEPAIETISLTLQAPVVSIDTLNTRDHWLEVSWNAEPADSYELELMTQAGHGVYRTVTPAAPVQLGWFSPGDYRVRVRALLGITPSPWSDDIELQIDDLQSPAPQFMPEVKDPIASGGMLSFSNQDPRSERIMYQVTGPGFNYNGDCMGAPVRLPPMLPGVYEFRCRCCWRDELSPWQAMTQQLSENVATPQNLQFTEDDEPGLWGQLSWESEQNQHRLVIYSLGDNAEPVRTIVTGHQYQVPVMKVGDYQAKVWALGRVEESEFAAISLSIARPQAPGDLVFTPFLNDNANAGEVSWGSVANSSGYQVCLCLDEEILVESRVSDNRWLIAPLTPGNYGVRVATISQREGALSDWSSVAFTLTGLDTPKGLTAQEGLIGSGIQIISQVVLGCEPVDGATHYEFEYQALGGNSWSGIQSGPAITATLNAIPPGSYTFRVRAVSGSRRSGYASFNFGVDGTHRPPAALKDLRLHAQAGSVAQLSWTLSTDPDVLTGGAIHVRHTHFIGTAATWDSAVPVTERLPGNATLTSVPLLLGTYLVKPVNATGYWAEEPVIAVSNMAGLIGYDRVEERVEPEGWPGEKNKAVVEAGDSLTFAESTDNNEPPFYIMEQPLDLGAVITARLTLEVDGSVYLRDTIDERTTLMDDWPLFDGAIPDDVSLRYEVSQTDDDPQSSGASWSQWTPFLKGEFRARGFRLRISMQGKAAGSAATISGLKLIADVPERTEQGVDLQAPISGMRVTYKTPFLKPAAIGVTAHALPASGRFVLSDQDAQGFNIRFYEGNTAIASSFNFTAVSYGEAEA